MPCPLFADNGCEGVSNVDGVSTVSDLMDNYTLPMAGVWFYYHRTSLPNWTSHAVGFLGTFHNLSRGSLDTGTSKTEANDLLVSIRNKSQN